MNMKFLINLFLRPKIQPIKSFHSFHNSKYIFISSTKFKRLTVNNKLYVCVFSMRNLNTKNDKPIYNENLTEKFISEVPETQFEPIDVLNVLEDETLQNVGLGSWTPVGLVQNALQFMHITFDIPWWLTIVAGTTILRLLVFPLVIASQRHSVKMNNIMPQIQSYQRQITYFRLQGNPYEMTKASKDLMQLLQTHQVNPIKGMILPIIQLPIFLSMFLGLREMAMLPLESLVCGGLWWFSDLTIPDPYFIMPFVTVVTLGTTLEFGIDVSKITSGVVYGKYVKYGLRVLPLAVFPFIMNFPGAVCLYWASTNFISLCQVMFLKIPKVRKYFNIDDDMKTKESGTKNGGFVDDFKESWKNMKIIKEIEEREYINNMKLKQISKSSPISTFKYDASIEGGLKKEKQRK
ncbi:mitochondrial inner membrane protein OXA1L-like isoform X2 [Daktulosphaira vitifoliae]|uniref:mitochondrial inner membrane protein OXA1L-like isoform X2 n=1 Tax=Daktulosphaira vitifoliae TaxID=58002 RepID=UPI0021AA4DFD|nr:mitochondrial inner membrane protein OXA1L-like isoform X2 [Daktulosphaira vitifoliae]